MKYIVTPKLTKALSLVIDIHCITIWPFVFCSSEPSDDDKLHEEVHGYQWSEIFGTLTAVTTPGLLVALPFLGWIGLGLIAFQLIINWLTFPLIYGLFYLHHWLLLADDPNRQSKAYHSIPFEIEAYTDYEWNPRHDRPYMNWIKYM